LRAIVSDRFVNVQAEKAVVEEENWWSRRIMPEVSSARCGLKPIKDPSWSQPVGSRFGRKALTIGASTGIERAVRTGRIHWE